MQDIYEFGGFRLETGRRLLTGHDGAPVALSPKALDTLMYLIAHRGTVVTKEALLQAVWPDTEVEENNLNQNISALRRALGGPRSENRFIVTVQGRGFSFVASVATRPTSEETNTTAHLRTVAVLPFRPLVVADSDSSLELGMADTLITRLSAIRRLVVRPISSVRRFTQSDVDPLLAGRQLGVESVLEGSLQKHGQKIRVTARLLNTVSGKALWTGTFDEQFTDIFTLQDSIAEKVVKALELKLSEADKTRLTKRHTASVEAYQLYLKGRFYWWKTDPQEFQLSREYFHRAVEIDPDYALGYCGLNSYYGFSSAWGLIPPTEGWSKAEWAIRKALELDDTLAEVHLGMAALKMINKDWAGAEAETMRAIELDPQFDEIHYFHSFLLMVIGRFDEAIAANKRALACNPFSVRINLQLANVFYVARRFEECIRQCREMIEMNPDDAAPHELLGDVLEIMADHSEAEEAWLRAANLAGDSEIARIIRNAASKGAGSVVRAMARKKLERAQSRVDKGEYVPCAQLARLHLMAGERESALSLLPKAAEERNVYSLLIARDPIYDSLKREPRFLSVLAGMNLPK